MRNLLVVGATLSLACAGVADAQGRGGGQGGGVGARPPPPPVTSPGRGPGPTLPSQTTVPGAADVLPGTSASPRGVERGSTSTNRAMQNFAANTDLRDSSGATVGRILQTVTLADGTTRVIVDIGGQTVSLPTTSLTMDGRFATSTLSRAQIRALADGPAR